MSDRQVYNLNVLGCDWTIQLMNHDITGGANGGIYHAHGQNVSITFNKIESKDHLISSVFDGLFDCIIAKFCGDEWSTKILANAVGQVFIDYKSRRVIDEMVTQFNRYNMRGEDYEKFDDNGVITSYMFDGIEIDKPHYWGFEIWIASIEGDERVEFGRFGFTEEYTLRIDPTKFADAGEVNATIDEYLEHSTSASFKGLEDCEPSYSYSDLQRKLKSTNYGEIKERIIAEFNDILAEFKD